MGATGNRVTLGENLVRGFESLPPSAWVRLQRSTSRIGRHAGSDAGVPRWSKSAGVRRLLCGCCPGAFQRRRVGKLAPAGAPAGGSASLSPGWFTGVVTRIRSTGAGGVRHWLCADRPGQRTHEARRRHGGTTPANCGRGMRVCRPDSDRQRYVAYIYRSLITTGEGRPDPAGARRSLGDDGRERNADGSLPTTASSVLVKLVRDGLGVTLLRIQVISPAGLGAMPSIAGRW